MGGGSSAPSEPSTTTTVQDIPAWEQGYVTNLLGQAQTEAAQPYQQFPGQQVAGFTDDQNQSFANVENAGNTNINNQNAAMSQAAAGSNSANSIYGAGSGDINAATSYNPLAAVSPYLGAASQYNAATAAQPGINQSQAYNAAAAGVATPQGIQSYLSPYTQNVVGGLENTANQNWNQNIMPGVNNEFVGSGQYGSGRNAQVLGQAANEEQTNLDTSVANALQAGYTTAGNQAATEAGILGNSANTAISGANAASNAQTAQIGNLINQGNTAGTATQQQAANLNTAGVNLGNLANTQAAQQLNSGATLGSLGVQSAATNLSQNQALNAVGLQQQQQNQTNINTAETNWQNQVQYPEQQTQFLNQIVRGLPAPSATTSAGEVTAPTTSPLQTLGGAELAGLSINSNGNGGVTTSKRGGLIKGHKKGGMIKGYAAGGNVGTYNDDDDNLSPLMMDSMAQNYYGSDQANAEPVAPPTADLPSPASPLASSDDTDTQSPSESSDDAATTTSDDAPTHPLADDTEQASITPEQEENEDNQDASSSSAPTNPLDTSKATAPTGITPQMMQQQQLLALARGMLTPNIGGQVGTAFGQGLGYLQDTTEKYQKMMADQNNLAYQRQMQGKRLDIQQQRADQMDDYRKAMMARPDLVQSKDAMGNTIWVDKHNPQATNIAPGSAQAAVNALDPRMKDLPSDVQDAMAKYPTAMQPIIRGVMEGRIPPDRQHLGMDPKVVLSAVSDIDPDFDVGTPKARMETATDFDSKGKSGQAITAYNTTSKHAAKMAIASLDLDNDKFTPWNTVANQASTVMGNNALKNYNNVLDVYAPEKTKVVSGKPNFSEKELQDVKADLSANGSKSQQLSNLADDAELMASKGSELQNTYNKNMGQVGMRITNPAIAKLDPNVLSSAQDLRTLSNHADKGTLDSPEAQQAIGRLRKFASLPDSAPSAGNQPAAGNSPNRIITTDQINAAAQKSGKTPQQVMQDAQAKGYSIAK